MTNIITIAIAIITITTTTTIIITRTKRLMNAGGDWKSWTMFGAWGGQSTSTIRWMMMMSINTMVRMMKLNLVVVKERGF